jgi:DNA-binding HxlR family transcriptional regulator
VSADDDLSMPTAPSADPALLGEPESDVCLAEVQDWINLLGEHWVIPVIGELADGPREYNDLLSSIGEGMSEPELASTVIRLEASGLIARTRPADADIDEPSAYTLTPPGQALLGPLASMDKWYRLHAHEIRADQAACDQQSCDCEHEAAAEG